jgi:hypothetical protein
VLQPQLERDSVDLPDALIRRERDGGAEL